MKIHQIKGRSVLMMLSSLSYNTYADSDTPPSALTQFLTLFDWRIVLAILGILAAVSLLLAWQNRIDAYGRARWLNNSALSLGVLGLSLTAFWAVMSPDAGFLPIIFLIGFIGMFIGREVGIQQAVEYFSNKHVARAVVISLALLVAYVALYSSGFFYAINASGDAAQQRLQQSQPALALDLQIENAQNRLNTMAVFADADKAYQDTQTAQQIAENLADAESRLKACKPNYFTLCINPTNQEIAKLKAQAAQHGSYAESHNQYLGLQQHLANLQQQRASLSASGHGVQSVWKSEDRFLSWLLGITPEQANNIKWLLYTLIFDLLSFLFRISASLTLQKASPESKLKQKINAFIDAGFSPVEALKILSINPETATPTNSYHDGGRVTQGNALGEQNAVLQQGEAVLNRGATQWLDFNAPEFIDWLNTQFANSQQASAPVQTPPHDSCVTMQETLRNMRDKQHTQSVDNAMRDNESPQRKVVHSTYQCDHCGKDYKARSTWQKYCSEACRLAANGVKDKGQMLRNKRKKNSQDDKP